MSFTVWRLMMMASMIPSTSSQLTLPIVSLATTVYFTCTDYDAKHTITVAPDDPPTITKTLGLISCPVILSHFLAITSQGPAKLSSIRHGDKDPGPADLAPV